MTPKCPDCKRDQDDCVCLAPDEMQQTIERQAAQIEMMREALTLIALDDCCTDPVPIAQEALAIQPDDSALKAWLGEPIGEVKKHTGSLKDMAIIVWSGEQPEEGAQLYIKPKGLK